MASRHVACDRCGHLIAIRAVADVAELEREIARLQKELEATAEALRKEHEQSKIVEEQIAWTRQEDRA